MRSRRSRARIRKGVGAGASSLAAEGERCVSKARTRAGAACVSSSNAPGGPSRRRTAGERPSPQRAGGTRMTEAEAQEFALEWIAAWNSHDLDRILGHYADDVEVTSPLVETILGPGRVTVRGKERLREYWVRALAKYPDLHFRLYRAYAGP